MSKQGISDYAIIDCELVSEEFQIGDFPETSKLFQLTNNIADGNVQLSCSLKKLDKLTNLEVDVIKSCPKPAMATIKLQLNDMKYHIRNVNNWKQTYKFDKIPFEYDSQDCLQHGSCTRSHKNIFSHIFSIIVRCKIIWYGFIDEFYSPNSGRVFTPYSYKMDFCDMKIKVGDNYYPVHKMMVSLRSSVFKKTLMADMKETQENCIDLTDLGTDVVEELIVFLYENRIDNAQDNEELLMKLLKVGDMYDITELKNCCGMLLSNKFTEENVLMLLENAHIYKSSILEARAIAFIVVEKREIINGNNFEELGLRHPKLLLESLYFYNLVA